MTPCGHKGRENMNCERKSGHLGYHAVAELKDSPAGLSGKCVMWDESGKPVGAEFEHIEHLATNSEDGA